MRRALTLATLSFSLPLSAFAATPQFSGLIPLPPVVIPPFPPFPQYSTYATMTPDGRLPGTSVTLPLALSDITVAPNGSGYYGVLFQSVVHIDPATQAVTTLNVAGPGITDNSWPIGITFDTARNRIVLATLGGEGFLMTCTPGGPNWSLLGSLNQVDFQSILYRPSDDTLYALPNGLFGPIDSLYKYGPDGQLLGQIPLSAALPYGTGAGDLNYQLLLTSDDQLAILLPYQSDLMDPSQPMPPRLYIVDPTTGAISYSAVFPVPEPSSLATLVSLSLLARRRTRQ